MPTSGIIPADRPRGREDLPIYVRIRGGRRALSRCLQRWVVAACLACPVIGCGGEEPVDFKDNAALSKPRPGMEAMKNQMLEAFKKAKRDPAKVAPNLVK